MKFPLLSFIVGLLAVGLYTPPLLPAPLHAVEVLVHNTEELRAAIGAAQPGTHILLAAGEYSGGQRFEELHGAPGQTIVIGAADAANPPHFKGGGSALQFSRITYVEIRDLRISGATDNGLNIDDGGRYDAATRHIVLRNLHISDIGPEGNRDGIKLSGVNDFRVENCVLERWGSGGSGVDMVGCHRGLIVGNTLRHEPGAGANGVQMKGGSENIIVRDNRFEHTGSRAVNIGGSTGLEFFRPPLRPQNGEVERTEFSEARDLTIEGNTIIGSAAALAFVGVDGAMVRFNTLYQPKNWALRFLMENRAPGFVPTRNVRFTDNLIVFETADWREGGVNIGPGTQPESMNFARNFWYASDRPERSRPTLPTPETDAIIGRDPLFRDASNGDLTLQPDSPATAVGAGALPR